MDKGLSDQWPRGVANEAELSIVERLQSLEETLYRGDWDQGVSALETVMEEVAPDAAEPYFRMMVNAAILLNNWMPESGEAEQKNLRMQVSLCHYVGEVSPFYMFHQLPDTKLEEGAFLSMARKSAQKTALRAIEELKQASSKDPNLMERMMEAVTFLERTKMGPDRSFQEMSYQPQADSFSAREL